MGHVTVRGNRWFFFRMAWIALLIAIIGRNGCLTIFGKITATTEGDG